MKLKYGHILFDLILPMEKVMGIIRPLPPASGEVSPEAVVVSAVDSCSLTIQSFRPGERVTIVTSDITRYTGSELYLPLLVERLNSSGIRDDDIEILIALGIHRKQTDEEHLKILGSLYGRIKVVDHDCDDPAAQVMLGKTSGGIDVEVNRRVVDTDHLILTGSIGYHYFAGFGGGRKAILPGVASRKSCMASHFAVLNADAGSGKNPWATTGNLERNPVHEAMMEACAMVGPDLLLNTIVGADGKIVAAFAGDWRSAHQAGCRYYTERFSVTIREKADLVIVSCGGFPKDINFIQAHKSMEYASRALREGGVMVLVTQCRDGYGHPGFFKWFRHADVAAHEAELRDNYEINGQTAYSVREKCGRFRIIMVSDLPPDEVASMGITPAVSLPEAIEKAERLLNSDYRCYIIPDGGVVLPVV